MKIIGIHDGHNASVALLEDGVIKYAIQEERIVRKKNYKGFPRNALYELFTDNNLQYADIDYFAIGSKHVGTGWITKEEMMEAYRNSADIQTKVKNILKQTPIKKVHRTKSQNARIREYETFGIDGRKVNFVDHHTSHTFTAYYGSHFRAQDVLVFTNDGAGDDLCATVSKFDKNGKYKRLSEIPERHSIGHLYALVTYILGMVPLEHEYKLMGMAPYAPANGAQTSYDALRDIYESIGEDGEFRVASDFPNMFNALKEVEKRIRFHRFDWIAAGIQQLTEKILTTWIKYWINKTHIHKIALAGGVFMNVKANQAIMEMDEVEDIFIFPSCGDETNVFGASYYIYSIKTDNLNFIPPLEHLYLGGGFTDNDIIQCILEAGLNDKYNVAYFDNIEYEIARLIAEGEIVARSKGSIEFGARALGNRSIIAKTQDWDTINTINRMVKKRDFWMPFAPSVRGDKANNYFEKKKNVKAPYMIFTFASKEDKRCVMRAALHPYDLSGRPQEVYEEQNPDYYKLITYFEEFTSESVVLNTSFNLHGLPIAYTPEDSVYVFENSGLKYLALGNYLISKEGRRQNLC